MANRTNHTSSDQSIRVSHSHNSAQPAQDLTQEQILTLLGELNDKLLPLPAPKPETVAPIDVQGFLPLQEARSALAAALESLERACNSIQAEADALIRKQSSARNERAWGVVFSQSRRDMRDMVGAAYITGNNLRSYANQLARLLVLAGDGMPVDLDAVQGGEGHE